MRSRREFLKWGYIATLLGCAPGIVQAAANAVPVGGRRKQFLKACTRGDTERIRQLLSADRQLLSATDQTGKSGFALALLASHQAAAAYLRQAGYGPDLHESALAADWERFETLLGEETPDTAARVNADHPVGGCAMWAAAAGGAGADIWRVYGRCGDPNCNPRAAAGSTPLQRALHVPDLATAEITAASLLSNDADPDPAPNADKPPLHLAAQRGSIELVEMLIRLGANPERQDHNGYTARQLAELSGQRKTWELLGSHHQIPRTCRSSRAAYTAEGQVYRLPADIADIPLFLRSRLVGQAHRNLEGVRKALEADPRMAHSVATTSEKAVEACAHMGNRPLVELLLHHGAPYALPTAVMLGDYTTVRRLLDEDPNRIHERGAHDFALLWYPAIGGCDLEMTRLLLERGAAVEQQHFLGTTALHWACMRGPIELVELLLDHGADPNRAGRKFSARGQRPLEMAEDEKIAALLRSRGAR